MRRSTPLSLGGRGRTGGACALRRLLVLVVAVATLMTFTPGAALAQPGDVVRGTAVADMALFEAQDASAAAVGSIYAGTTLQALDMGDGWYAASFAGAVRYFYGADSLALYTADNSDVMRGAVVGGALDVRAVPNPAGAVSDTFAEGATIQFCDFNSSYYMARLSDGSICYIDAAQVRLYAPTESGTLTRWASASGARAFAAPDESSTVLATFEAGTRLYFADFDAEWLMARMSVDGAARTVFVPKSEVLTEEPQPEPAPEVTTTWVITADATAGYASASYDAEELEQFRKGAVLTAAPSDGGWYRVTYDGQEMYLAPDAVKEIPASSRTVTQHAYAVTLGEAVAIQNKGTWIVGSDTSSRATVDELRTYMDPSNFREGTSGFFQFLVLTQPMGVSASVLDAELEGKGTLEGMGQAFSEAAYTYGVNEIYLISHALHETGNGWSRLAQGVWYDPATETASAEKVNDADVLVYNMYGIGAVDSNPLNGGAKYAYDHGWTTPYAAVVGGAGFIARTYLYSDDEAGTGYDCTLSGQNTLYKMLYHPEWVEQMGTKPWHEYATDVAWANAQTYFYTRMLADFDNYSLVFEVPVYAGE